jgi:hypothetical protein
MHAASNTREAFCDLLEEFASGNNSIKVIGQLYALAGHLWNSTDQLPGMYHDDVERLANRVEEERWRRRGGTYAAAARIVRAEMMRRSLTGSGWRIRVPAGRAA